MQKLVIYLRGAENWNAHSPVPVSVSTDTSLHVERRSVAKQTGGARQGQPRLLLSFPRLKLTLEARERGRAVGWEQLVVRGWNPEPLHTLSP